jgi:hypothetical protein
MEVFLMFDCWWVAGADSWIAIYIFEGKGWV